MPGSRPSRNCEVEYSTLKFQSQGTLAKLFSYFISPLHSKNPEMYYVKDKLTTQYITLADGSFVAEYQKLEFCDRLAGGAGAGASGNDLDALSFYKPR